MLQYLLQIWHQIFYKIDGIICTDNYKHLLAKNVLSTE